MPRSPAWLAAFAVLLAAAPARAQRAEGDEASAPIPRSGVHVGGRLSVQSEPAGCLLAGWFPVLRARVDPPLPADRARLRFRPEGYALWYEVPARPGAEGYVAVLPKPRPSARRVHYYFDVQMAGARARSTEQVATVVEERAQCAGPLAEAVESASVPVTVPRGAPAVPPVPPGFVPAGAVSAEAGRAERSLKEPLLVLAGVGAAAAGLIAIPTGGPTRPMAAAGVPQEVVWLDSSPPPGSTLSLGNANLFTVRLTIQPRRRVGTGLIQVMLYRSNEGRTNPCAVVGADHGVFEAGVLQNFTLSGPLLQGRTCAPADRLLILVSEGGREVLTREYQPFFFVVS